MLSFKLEFKENPPAGAPSQIQVEDVSTLYKLLDDKTELELGGLKYTISEIKYSVEAPGTNVRVDLIVVAEAVEVVEPAVADEPAEEPAAEEEKKSSSRWKKSQT